MKKRVSFFFVVSVVFFLTACKIESQNNAMIEWAKYIDDTHIEIYGKGDWGNILHISNTHSEGVQLTI